MYKNFNITNRLTAFVVLIFLGGSYVSGQNTSAKTVSDEQINAKVNEYMEATVKVDGFSGSILIARDGKPVVSRGYGMANVELDVPNTPQTVFRVGSVTKQFTGMATAMLAERGKLNVNDSICKYLTVCPEIWKPITVKNLLTHTSGIKNYTSFPEFAKIAVLPMSSDEMLALLKDKPLDFVPGEKFAYSNSGYYLLGLIIERTSGKSYADFLRENIFTPLGMKNTDYDSPIRIIKNRASGYTRQGGEVINASYMDMTIPYAAGALYSTTGDMLLWDQALYTEKLVSQKTLDEVFTPFKNGYGYGWGIGKKFNRREISHGGNIYGFAAEIARFPDDKITVVVLSNAQGASAGRIGNDLAAIYFGEAYEIPQERKEIAVDAKILEKYVGEYKIEQPNVTISILFENGKLMGQVMWQGKFALAAESETAFFSRDVNAKITFDKDTDGNVTGLTLHQGGGKFPAKKIK